MARRGCRSGKSVHYKNKGVIEENIFAESDTAPGYTVSKVRVHLPLSDSSTSSNTHNTTSKPYRTPLFLPPPYMPSGSPSPSSSYLNELFRVTILPQIPEEDGISPKDPEISLTQEYPLTTFIAHLEQLRHRNRQMDVARIEILHRMIEMKFTFCQKCLITDIPYLIRIRCIQTFIFLFDYFCAPSARDIIHNSLNDMIEHMYLFRSSLYSDKSFA